MQKVEIKLYGCRALVDSDQVDLLLKKQSFVQRALNTNDEQLKLKLAKQIALLNSSIRQNIQLV